MGNKCCSQLTSEQNDNTVDSKQHVDKKKSKSKRKAHKDRMTRKIQTIMKIYLMKKKSMQSREDEEDRKLNLILPLESGVNDQKEPLQTPRGDIYKKIKSKQVKAVLRKFPRFEFKVEVKKGLEYRPIEQIEGGSAHYEGQWNSTSGLKEGRGVIVWQDSALFQGFWKDGKPHGQGLYIGADAGYYYGDWKQGKMEGEGVEVSADGGKYEGQFSQDKHHGKGRYTWTNGNEYNGEFIQGKRTGYGTFIMRAKAIVNSSLSLSKQQSAAASSGLWEAGDKYEGQWKNNKMHGKGVLNSSDGTKYVGEFNKGMKDGHGKIIYSDGSMYDGEWFNDRKNGKGILTESSGQMMKAKFEHDKLIAKKPLDHNPNHAIETTSASNLR